MNERLDDGSVHKTASKECSDCDNSQKDLRANTQESCSDTFDLRDCSDAVEDILKEGNGPVPAENTQLNDDDASGMSDYSSATEECNDPVRQALSVEDEECNTNELKDDEADEEQLKEMQKDWSDEDVQVHKAEALSLKNEGNDHFKSGRYQEAVHSYTQALNTCPLTCAPERAVLYANRAAAKISLEQKEEAVLDCNKALELNPDYLKALLRRAQLHRKLENLDQCLADYQKVLELDPNSREAREACMVLPQEINERNEKLKTEMLGKLKELGNLVLRPFGLSTDNFNLVQDPNSGGYSINFQNNKNGK